MNRAGIKSIITNASYLGTARLLTSSARIIYAVLLARYLGAELYGQYNYGLSWYLFFLPLSVLGINWVLAREIGADPKKTASLVKHTFLIRLTSSLTAAFLSLSASLLLEPSPQLKTLLIIFSLALAARSFALWQQAVFVARESSGYVLLQETIFRLAEVVGGILFLLYGYGIHALALLHALVWIAQAIFSGILLRKLIEPVAIPTDLQEIRRILGKGIPLLIASLFGSWLLQGPLLMYRHFQGLDEQLGFLALSLQAFIIVAMIAGELGNAALPVLSRSIDRGDGKSDRYVEEVLRFGCFMGGLLTIGGVTLGEPFIELVIGARYLPVAGLLPWTLLIVTFHFWMSSLYGMVAVHGHFKRVILDNALGAAVFTTGFVLLVPSLGAIGVVMALGGGLFSAAMLHLLALGKYHRIAWTKKLVKPALSASFGILAARFFLDAGYWSALLLGIVSMVMAAFLTGALSLNEIKVMVDRKHFR